MSKPSKRRQAFQEKIEAGKHYSFSEAVRLIQEFSKVKFRESVDIAIRLSIDTRKSDQAVRGSVFLPNGTGKNVRVAVFAQGSHATKAVDAGADVVGLEDLVDQVKKNDINFDVVIATPDVMSLVGQLGKILGPKGMMPNPKIGTVTSDVATAVRNVKEGQIRYRADKNGIIHCTIGKADFDVDALQENIQALLVHLKKTKPVAAKGSYLKKLVISSTMGPGVIVDLASL